MSSVCKIFFPHFSLRFVVFFVFVLYNIDGVNAVFPLDIFDCLLNSISIGLDKAGKFFNMYVSCMKSMHDKIARIDTCPCV